jgi:peptide/nickel transport system substrate-binding protein
MAKKLHSSLIKFFFFFVILWLPIYVFAEKAETIRVEIPIFMETLNVLETKGPTDVLNDLIHQGIIRFHPKTGEYVNYLAKSIQVMPNKKDIRITLRKGPTFHTGDPVTAHDVKFTHEQIGNSNNSNIYASLAQEVEHFEIIDDYTYVLHFYEPYGPWRQLLLGGICSKNYFEKVGREEFRSNPIGSGPLKFAAFDKGVGYRFERVENHIDKKVDFKNLEFIVVPDEITRLSMLQTGELDLIWEIPPHQLKRLKLDPAIKIKKTDQYPSLIGVSWNVMQFPEMNDKKLKQAMAMGVNRKEIIEKALLGEGYPLYHDASKVELGYDPNYKIEFNPDKARELVRQSNYKTATPLVMSYDNLVPMAPVVAQIFQKYMSNIGITIKLQQLESGIRSTWTRTHDKRLGQLMLYSFAPGVDPHYRLMLSIMSNGAYTAYRNRPNKKEMDALCMAQSYEPDAQKRLAILRKIQKLIIKDPGSIKLFGINMIYATRTRIDYTWVPRTIMPRGLAEIKIMKPDK